MRTSAQSRIARLSGAVRWLWPDRNPLRRRSDRIEAWTIAGLCAAFLAAAPAVALFAGGYAYRAADSAEHSAAYQVEATLLASARAGGGSHWTAPARWRFGSGAIRVGRFQTADTTWARRA